MFVYILDQYRCWKAIPSEQSTICLARDGQLHISLLPIPATERRKSLIISPMSLEDISFQINTGHPLTAANRLRMSEKYALRQTETCFAEKLRSLPAGSHILTKGGEDLRLLAEPFVKICASIPMFRVKVCPADVYDEYVRLSTEAAYKLQLLSYSGADQLSFIYTATLAGENLEDRDRDVADVFPQSDEECSRVEAIRDDLHVFYSALGMDKIPPLTSDDSSKSHGGANTPPEQEQRLPLNRTDKIFAWCFMIVLFSFLVLEFGKSAVYWIGVK